jgi:hypothetical protein
MKGEGEGRGGGGRKKGAEGRKGRSHAEANPPQIQPCCAPHFAPNQH